MLAIKVKRFFWQFFSHNQHRVNDIPPMPLLTRSILIPFNVSDRKKVPAPKLERQRKFFRRPENRCPAGSSRTKAS
jgi:hypothetical protein